MSAADHYQRLARQAESFDHHRALLRLSVRCLGAVALIIIFASLFQ